MRDVEVVVVHESDATAELGVERTAEDLLELMLADFVCGMRLPGEHDLDGAPGAVRILARRSGSEKTSSERL